MCKNSFRFSFYFYVFFISIFLPCFCHFKIHVSLCSISVALSSFHFLFSRFYFDRLVWCMAFDCTWNWKMQKWWWRRKLHTSHAHIGDTHTKRHCQKSYSLTWEWVFLRVWFTDKKKRTKVKRRIYSLNKWTEIWSNYVIYLRFSVNFLGMPTKRIEFSEMENCERAGYIQNNIRSYSLRKIEKRQKRGMGCNFERKDILRVSLFWSELQLC